MITIARGELIDLGPVERERPVHPSRHVELAREIQMRLGEGL